MVSIIIPVIREKSFNECLGAIEKNCDGIKYEVVWEIDNERIGVAQMVKNLLAKTKYDLVMFLGDDTIPQPGFMSEAIKAMAYLPDGWGMVGLDDGRRIRHEATHFLIDKRMLPLIGGEIFHTGYKHCFCDSELGLRARLLHRFAFAERAKIKHNHPLLDSNVKSDEDYNRVYSPNYFMHDQLLFSKRRENIIKEYAERNK